MKAKHLLLDNVCLDIHAICECRAQNSGHIDNLRLMVQSIILRSLWLSTCTPSRPAFKNKHFRHWETMNLNCLKFLLAYRCQTNIWVLKQTSFRLLTATPWKNQCAFFLYFLFSRNTSAGWIFIQWTIPSGKTLKRKFLGRKKVKSKFPYRGNSNCHRLRLMLSHNFTDDAA